MKMLLFKPELGTLTRFDYPKEGRINTLVDTCFNTHKIIIDGVDYKFFTSSNLKAAVDNSLWSFYQMSTDLCFYGNIVIGLYGPIPSEEKDITAEDMLRIRSHIVVRNKGYMIYLDK